MSGPDEMDDPEPADQAANDGHQQVAPQLRARYMEDKTLPSSSPRQEEQNGSCLDAVEDEENPT